MEIPNDGSATRFSLSDVVGSGPWASARLYLTWHINERHGIRLLATPLSITENGSLAGPAVFAGETFAPGDVRAT